MAGLIVFAAPAGAQVTLDMRALDQGQAPSQRERPSQRPRQADRKPGRKPAEPSAPAAPATSTPAPSGAVQALPPLPGAPPAIVSLAPIVVEPPAGRPEPAPAPPLSASAGGAVEAIESGLRVLFSPERADLTPASQERIKTYLAGLPDREAASFDVVAYAAGGPEDPSTPRRLSLSRGLAIRSVLMGEGVASARIYLRALGTANPGGPPDRVDITALGNPGQRTDRPK